MGHNNEKEKLLENNMKIHSELTPHDDKNCWFRAMKSFSLFFVFVKVSYRHPKKTKIPTKKTFIFDWYRFFVSSCSSFFHCQIQFFRFFPMMMVGRALVELQFYAKMNVTVTEKKGIFTEKINCIWMFSLVK